MLLDPQEGSGVPIRSYSQFSPGKKKGRKNVEKFLNIVENVENIKKM